MAKKSDDKVALWKTLLRLGAFIALAWLPTIGFIDSVAPAEWVGPLSLGLLLCAPVLVLSGLGLGLVELLASRQKQMEAASQDAGPSEAVDPATATTT